MKNSCPVYVFMDCSKPVPQLPHWQGETICHIFEARDVQKAIECFLKFYPEFQIDGKLKSFITFSTIF